MYSLPDVRIHLGLVRLAGHLAGIEGGRNAEKVIVGKREAERPLGGPKHRWDGNIKWI